MAGKPVRFENKAQALRAVKMLCDDASDMAGGIFPSEGSADLKEGEWGLEDQRRFIEKCRRALNAMVRSHFGRRAKSRPRRQYPEARD